jgi:hypothetical protein
MMQQQSRSPKVLRLSWGRLEVEGQDYPFKDAKLFPGGAREWDWKETGTSHEPGIQPTDVEEVLKHGVTAVVFGRGFYERLQVQPEALQELEERNITAHVGQTEQAVRLYNELSKSERVGALIHSTC